MANTSPSSQLGPEDTAGAPDKPRLLVFWSERSGHCRRVDGYLAAVLQRNGNHDAFRVQRISLERRPDLHEHFGVTSVPTLVVVEGRRVVGRLDRIRGIPDLRDLLEPWLFGKPPAPGARMGAGAGTEAVAA